MNPEQQHIQWRNRLDAAVVEARKWAKAALADRAQPQLQTLTLYVDDVDASAAWYADAVGFTWTQEQHGSGREHVSAQFGGLLIELYPRGSRPTSQVRIELSVGDRFSDADRSPDVFPRRFIDPDGNVIAVALRD